MADSKTDGVPGTGDLNIAPLARHASAPLVDDLFDVPSPPLASANVPLDPEHFDPANPIAASREPQINIGAPVESAPPLDLQSEHPPFGGALARPPQELDLGFTSGSGYSEAPQSTETPDAQEALLALPLGSKPSEPAEAVRSPRLPCSVVIITQTRAAGAQLATGLMGLGYTCRICLPAEARDALSAPGVDVVISDMCSRAQCSPCGLKQWTGAKILVGAGPDFQPEPGQKIVRHPSVEGELMTAIEVAREEFLLVGAEAEAHRTPVLSAVPKIPNAITPIPMARIMRGDSLSKAGHVELSVHKVRALMVSQSGSTTRGRVISMSVGGQMLVDLTAPFEFGTLVNVELIVVDGQRAELGGTVGRSGEGQILIELDVPTEQASLLKRFITEAQDVAQPSIEQIRIRERAKTEVAPVDFVDDKTLADLFDVAAASLDDDATQQSFIQACIQAQRLQFAVQCYRELKNDHPEDERVARYLNQVGTILGFYAFRKADGDKTDEGMPRTMKWALGAFVFAALVMWVIVELATSTGSG